MKNITIGFGVYNLFDEVVDEILKLRNERSVQLADYELLKITHSECHAINDEYSQRNAALRADVDKLRDELDAYKAALEKSKSNTIEMREHYCRVVNEHAECQEVESALTEKIETLRLNLLKKYDECNGLQEDLAALRLTRPNTTKSKMMDSERVTLQTISQTIQNMLIADSSK